jgi:hypothetical protein
MKTLKTIIKLTLCATVLFSTSSCFVFVGHSDGGKRGWHKNTNNPHNPQTTNPGKSRGNKK